MNDPNKMGVNLPLETPWWYLLILFYGSNLKAAKG